MAYGVLWGSVLFQYRALLVGKYRILEERLKRKYGQCDVECVALTGLYDTDDFSSRLERMLLDERCVPAYELLTLECASGWRSLVLVKRDRVLVVPVKLALDRALEGTRKVLRELLGRSSALVECVCDVPVRSE